MQITVFGANGKVGTLVVKKLLADGHSVRAFVHSSSSFKQHPRLRVVKGDIHDPKAVAAVLHGSDAVISALGSWHTKSKDIVSSGMSVIIPAMEGLGIARIVSLTGAGAGDSEDDPSKLDRLSRWFIRLIARKVFDDGEKHVAMLRNSSLQWTVVRSPAMRASSHGSQYMLSKKSPLPWAFIARANVSTAMVDLINGKEWLRSAPFIKRR